jgi:di/tricarboxylate transporter
VQDPITWKQAYVIFISLATVGLWCANSVLDKYLGQMGIVAIIPMVFFFGFGLLNKASHTPKGLTLPLGVLVIPASTLSLTHVLCYRQPQVWRAVVDIYASAFKTCF